MGFEPDMRSAGQRVKAGTSSTSYKCIAFYTSPRDVTGDFWTRWDSLFLNIEGCFFLFFHQDLEARLSSCQGGHASHQKVVRLNPMTGYCWTPVTYFLPYAECCVLDLSWTAQRYFWVVYESRFMSPLRHSPDRRHIFYCVCWREVKWGPLPFPVESCPALSLAAAHKRLAQARYLVRVGT